MREQEIFENRETIQKLEDKIIQKHDKYKGIKENLKNELITNQGSSDKLLQLREKYNKLKVEKNSF